MRSHNLKISHLLLCAAKESFKLMANNCSVWQPHRQTSANLRRDHKKLKLFTEFTMIALLSFFTRSDELIKFFLCRKANAV